MDIALSVLKIIKNTIAQKILEKSFAFHQKPMKGGKLFSCLTFVVNNSS